MHAHNWQPDDLSDDDTYLMESIPKATLYVIARQLAARAAGLCDTLDAGTSAIADEWIAQHRAGFVPQRPTKRATEIAARGQSAENYTA